MSIHIEKVDKMTNGLLFMGMVTGLYLNGKNILSGVVDTHKQKFLASSVARFVKGSCRVVNQLVVK